jgi:hypothetical protein
MIVPTTSWFKIVELPTVGLEMTVPPVGKGKKVKCAKTLRRQTLLLARVHHKSVT